MKTKQPNATDLTELELKRRFPIHFTTQTGNVVRYRRIPVRGGFDIEAVILPRAPKPKPDDSKG